MIVAAGTRDTGTRSRSPYERHRRRILVPMMLPALALYLALLVAPTVDSAWISFHQWRGNGPMKNRGLSNYRVLFQDPTFRTAFKNTFVILIGVGLAVFVLSFAITMVLYEMRGRQFIRMVMFLPAIISSVALSIIWGFIFQYDGLANDLLDNFGIGKVSWLAPNHLFDIILLGLLWINAGLYVIIILAAVDRIPAYLYEDAALGGAGPWQRFRHITLPLSWDVVSVAAILWTINSLKMFEFIYAFGGSGTALPDPSAWNSAVFVYAESFGGMNPAYQFGYASASALLMLVMFAVLVVVLRRLLRRKAVQF
jgi:raffinose/stachyose/melibiose transport system permease protein